MRSSGLDRRLAASVDRLSRRLDKYTASTKPPLSELRQRVCALAEDQWDEPAVAVYLGEVEPEFAVPGRRKDGTIKGERRLRRFFWNILRGAFGIPINVALSVAGGGAANIFARNGRVTGPADAQALDLIDAAGPATNPWLVYSPAHVAIIDSDESPVILWHATKPHAPKVSPTRRRLSWPDGSVFQYGIAA